MEGRRDLEARSVVASSRVLRWRNGVSRFRFRLPVVVLREANLPQAAVRPLVRIPTDRHVATGTCEFGQGRYSRCWRERKSYTASVNATQFVSVVGSWPEQLCRRNRNIVCSQVDSAAKVRQRSRPDFIASLVRFLNKDAEDLIGRCRSNVDRSKWNCEAIKHRFQMSMRFS